MKSYLVVLGWLVLSCCSTGALAVELVLYNWEGYIADSVVEKFESETGHTIKQIFFNSDEERDELLVNTGGKGFDLVVVEAVANQTLGENGFLQGFDAGLLELIEPSWRNSCGNFGVPYFWGTLGIAYRADLVKEPPASWRDLLVPAPENQGRVAMLLDSVDTLVPPLKLLGKSMNDGSRDGLKAAYDLLRAQAVHVNTYDYILYYEGREAVSLALAYGGAQHILSEQTGDQWQYVIPREGTALWVDCMAVPADSEHKAEALAFIEFINRADIAAENAADQWQATPNSGALELLDSELRDDELVFPAEDVIKNSELYMRQSNQSMSMRNRIIYSLGRNR